MPASRYEVVAIRFASKTRTKAQEFQCFEVYHDEDGPCQMANFLWLVRNEERVVLVDTGFGTEAGVRRGRVQEIEPLEALAEVGVRPEDVERVIVSHMHWDHIGNLSRFPNARFTIAAAEYDFWLSEIANRTLFAWAIENDEIQAVRDLVESGRVDLVDGDQEVEPGIRIWQSSGHTPGSIITEVESETGVTVLAADALHLYDEMELDRPYYVFTDLAETYRAYERLRSLAGQEGTVVVAGHDPQVLDRFPAYRDLRYAAKVG